MSHCFKKHQRGLAQGGFTLMELLVSIGVVSIIMSVVVFNQATYTDKAALANLADEISSVISQAQAYGVAVRELTPGSSDFTASYGITLSLLDSGSNSMYLFFADRNDNSIYDGDWSCPTGGIAECLEKVDMVRGNYIEDICVVRTSGADLCNSAQRIDVSFVRPHVEAEIIFFNNGGQIFNPGNVKGARIVLNSPGGSTRSVIIYNTGQISVQ